MRGRRYALVDSPVALLTWTVDEFAEWTDTGPEERVSRDRMLDDVSLHWFDASGASAARIYRESHDDYDKTSPVVVPAAVPVFPRDIEKLPRPWVEHRFTDLRRWSLLDRGGHFPGLEVPDLLVDELRAAFPVG